MTKDDKILRELLVKTERRLGTGRASEFACIVFRSVIEDYYEPEGRILENESHPKIVELREWFAGQKPSLGNPNEEFMLHEFFINDSGIWWTYTCRYGDEVFKEAMTEKKRFINHLIARIDEQK